MARSSVSTQSCQFLQAHSLLSNIRIGQFGQHRILPIYCFICFGMIYATATVMIPLLERNPLINWPLLPNGF